MQSPRLSASWAVFLICARKASASSPASSRPLPNCRVVFSAALVALPTFCAAAAASSAASEKAAAPFRAAVQAETFRRRTSVRPFRRPRAFAFQLVNPFGLAVLSSYRRRWSQILRHIEALLHRPPVSPPWKRSSPRKIRELLSAFRFLPRFREPFSIYKSLASTASRYSAKSMPLSSE